MLFLVHKNWKRKSVNRFLSSLRASNCLFMVVGILMVMTILWILEEDEGDRVKYAFSKKKVMAFSWIIWTLEVKEASQSSKKNMDWFCVWLQVLSHICKKPNYLNKIVFFTYKFCKILKWNMLKYSF